MSTFPIKIYRTSSNSVYVAFGDGILYRNGVMEEILLTGCMIDDARLVDLVRNKRQGYKQYIFPKENFQLGMRLILESASQILVTNKVEDYIFLEDERILALHIFNWTMNLRGNL